MSKFFKDRGILLKKIFLANEDALLEFFTQEQGKIVVISKKLKKSKKRIAQIDFFRFLDLEIQKNKNTKILKNANTCILFRGFEKNYQSLQLGFLWCDLLQKNLVTEKPQPKFFQKIIKIFSFFDGKNLESFAIFFRIKFLYFLGFLPDLSDDFVIKKISPSSIKTLIFFKKNLIDKSIKFFDDIPKKNLQELDIFLKKLEEGNIH